MAEQTADRSARSSFYLLLLVVLLLALSSLRSYFHEEPEWAPFVQSEGGFSVLVAGQPEQRTLAEELPAGPVSSRYLTFARSGVQYAVTYLDLPTGYLGETTPDTILRQAAEALAKRVQGELLDTSEHPLKEHPGIGFRIEAGDGSLLIGRCHLVDGRLYTLMAGMEEEEEPIRSEVETFFDSFTLLPRDGENP